MYGGKKVRMSSKIDDNVPMPRRAPYGKWADLFRRLKVGQSTVVDRKGLMGMEISAFRVAGRGALVRKKITPESYRVWRVK